MYFEHKELLKPPIARAAYSDRTAWLMAELSYLAYLKYEVDKKQKLESCLKEAELDLVNIYNQGGTQAYLAKNINSNMAVLAFRGTEIEGLTLETMLDVWTDLFFKYHKDDRGVLTHKGFLNAFENVREHIQSDLRTIPEFSLYITGHSLGGALALIATKIFNSDNIAACYTFGSPKVGNEDFDDEIKPPIYRVVNDVDLVPFLPFTPIMHVLSIFNKKCKKLKKLLTYMSHYKHTGHVQFLEKTKGSKAEIKTRKNYGEITRSIDLLRRTITKNKKAGVDCHSMDEYCKKLAKYAQQRLK